MYIINTNIHKTNEIKYYIANPLHSCGLALVGTGSIIQGFLIECGVSDGNVTFFVSIMLVIQMLAMTFTSGAVENMKNIIKVSALLPLFHLPLLCILIFFCLTEAPASTVFTAVFAAGVPAAAFYGLHGVLSYKLPYKIMDIKEYGRILGVSGVFLGFFSTLFSFVISYFTSPKYDYFFVMMIFFLVGILMFILNAAVASSFREIPDLSRTDIKNKKINIFRYKPFYILLMPNLLRGFHTGVWGVILVIGNRCGIIDGKKGAVLTVLLQLALMIGCFIYSRLSSKVEDGKLILFSSILTAVTAPIMLLGKNPTIFFVIYLAVSLFKNFIDYGVPTAVTKIVDYRCIGQYSAWRMVLHTLGTALGGIAVTGMTFMGITLPGLMDIFGGIGTLIIAGAFQVISGAVYYWYTNIYIKKAGSNATASKT